MAEIKMEVYDRWGNQVFLNNNFLPGDPSLGWDGSFKGKSMNSGVFVYQAIIRFIDGETLIYKGDVTLIR